MFIHGKTGKKYYSVNDKIRYYNNIIKGSIKADASLKNKAKERLPELYKIHNEKYLEPQLIVADDINFGNPIHKPRLCVVIGAGKDKKSDKIRIAPLQKRTTKAIILNNYPNRQVDERNKWIDKNAVYETKYFDNVKPLTEYDRNMIKSVYKN